MGGSALWQRGRARGLLDDDDEAAVSVSLAVDVLPADHLRSARSGQLAQQRSVDLTWVRH